MKHYTEDIAKRRGEHVREMLLDYITQTETAISPYEFTREDMSTIEALVRDKYGSWEWNIGYGPAYTLDCNFEWEERSFHICLKVKKGIITGATVESGGISPGCRVKLEESLQNIKHKSSVIRNSLLNLSGECFHHDRVSGFVEHLF